MKAIILAGGRGERLRPITDKIPKPLIPINNVPLIERSIKYLKKYGINEIIISSGYKSNKIESFLKKKKNFGCQIIFSIESTPLGTGGAIKKALKHVDEESFLVLNGDVVTNIDLRKILKKPNTIAANELKTKFGTMNIKNNKILKFKKKCKGKINPKNVNLLKYHDLKKCGLSKQKVKGIKELVTNTDTNIIISDDGLQHYSMPRDVEIAVFDGARGLGNGLCLPAGPLREPIERINSVDFIIRPKTGMPKSRRWRKCIPKGLNSSNDIIKINIPKAKPCWLRNSDK